MKNLIGGLFETSENANRAYQALQNSGFSNQDVQMFIPKPRNKTIRATNVKIQDIGKSALIGGLILGCIGAFIGYLVGTGSIPLPFVDRAFGNINQAFVTASVMAGAVGGGLTGIILGVASRLLRSEEKAEVMTRKIEQGGVLVTINVGDPQSEAKASRVLKENAAKDVGYTSEKWDMKTWISPNEPNPYLATTRRNGR